MLNLSAIPMKFHLKLSALLLAVAFMAMDTTVRCQTKLDRKFGVARVDLTTEFPTTSTIPQLLPGWIEIMEEVAFLPDGRLLTVSYDDVENDRPWISQPVIANQPKFLKPPQGCGQTRPYRDYRLITIWNPATGEREITRTTPHFPLCMPIPDTNFLILFDEAGACCSTPIGRAIALDVVDPKRSLHLTNPGKWERHNNSDYFNTDSMDAVLVGDDPNGRSIRWRLFVQGQRTGRFDLTAGRFIPYKQIPDGIRSVGPRADWNWRRPLEERARGKYNADGLWPPILMPTNPGDSMTSVVPGRSGFDLQVTTMLYSDRQRRDFQRRGFAPVRFEDRFQVLDKLGKAVGGEYVVPRLWQPGMALISKDGKYLALVNGELTVYGTESNATHILLKAKEDLSPEGVRTYGRILRKHTPSESRARMLRRLVGKDLDDTPQTMP